MDYAVAELKPRTPPQNEYSTKVQPKFTELIYMDRVMKAPVRRLKMAGNEAGYSLIEVMIASGLLAVMSFAIAMTAERVAIRMAKTGNLTKIDVAKTNVANLILSEGSWQASINGTLNSGIKTCLQSLATTPPCTPPSWCSRFYIASLCSCSSSSSSNSSRGFRFPSSSSNCPTSLAASPNFSLYDASGALFYNAQNTANGFNEVGVQCGPDAPLAQNRAYNYPSANCPYRYDLRWYTIPNGSTSPPVIGVKAALQVAPNFNSQLNKDRYSVPLMFRPGK